MKAPVRATHVPQEVTPTTIKAAVAHNARAFTTNVPTLQTTTTAKTKAGSAPKASVRHCKTATVHSVLTSHVKAVTAVRSRVATIITVAGASEGRNKVAIARVSTTIPTTCRPAATNLACKVATEGRNKEAIGLASTAIPTTHKAAISPDSKADTVVRKVVTTTIAAATTTTVAVMASKVATTTAEVTTIAAVMGVRKAAITTTMATTIGRATTQMRNIASKNALNTKKSTLILTSRYA